VANEWLWLWKMSGCSCGSAAVVAIAIAAATDITAIETGIAPWLLAAGVM